MKTRNKALALIAGLGLGLGIATAIWDSEPKAAAQSCVMSGYLVNTCGCWGPVEFGRSYPDGRCCSGWSTPVACFGGCSAGGSPYKVVCN